MFNYLIIFIMKSYKILELGNEILLLQCNKGEYSTTLIDKGTEYETFYDGLLIGLEKETGYTYYLADEETQTLKKIADNVYLFRSFTDEHFGKIALYQTENRFELMKLDNLEKIDLGSWFERGYFLSGKESDLKARFFLNCIYTEREYVSVNYWRKIRRGCHNYFAVFLRKDGLYDVFGAFDSNADIEDDLNIEKIERQYLRVFIDEDDLNMCQIYFYDKEKAGYVQIFEGKNRINIDNAVLEIIDPAEKENSEEHAGEEKSKVLLYIFDGAEKILLAQTDNIDSIKVDYYGIVIDNLKWTTNKDNNYLLNRVPQEIETQENTEEAEDENSEDNTEFHFEPEVDTEYRPEPEKKKSGWWRRLWK